MVSKGRYDVTCFVIDVFIAHLLVQPNLTRSQLTHVVVIMHFSRWMYVPSNNPFFQ